MIVIPKGRWCSCKPSILSGKTFEPFTYLWPLALALFELVLLAKLAQWQPLNWESQTVQVLCAFILGWHVSVNAANSITLAVLNPKDLAALELSQKRLASLLENLPLREVRMDDGRLVLNPVLGLNLESQRAGGGDEATKLQEENQWGKVTPDGYELHYDGGIVRLELGTLPTHSWIRVPGSSDRLGVTESLRREIAALAGAIGHLEERFPERCVPRQGPPRVPGRPWKGS